MSVHQVGVVVHAPAPPPKLFTSVGWYLPVVILVGHTTCCPLDIHRETAASVQCLVMSLVGAHFIVVFPDDHTNIPTLS